MADFERIPETKDKFGEFQKKYNVTTKGIAKILGTNIALFVCLLLPVLLIGFIWTDFGMPTLGVRYVSEGIVTVALFVIGEIMMSKIGAEGGKLDPEYIESKKTLNALIDEINTIGTRFINIFCDWQIDIELEHAVTTRLRSLHITKTEWEVIKGMSRSELKEKYGRKKARSIMAVIDLPPIELDECILLYDNSEESFGRGGVPISGEGYLNKRMRSYKTILYLIFTGLLTVSVAITLTADISWARVVYTVFKLVVLLYRMAVGYNLGAKAYNRIEVGQIQAKCNYLRQYIKFVKDKTYLLLGDKYGILECVKEEKAEEPPAIAQEVVEAVEATT